MTTEIEIIATDIARVAAAVRALGSSRLIVNNMAKEIRTAVPPIRTGIKANAIAYLPRRGGFGKWVARARVTARIRRSASNAGINIVAGRNSDGSRTDLRGIDAGMTRHPYWGDRHHWAPQTVRAGYASDAVEAGADVFIVACGTAVDHAIREVGL